MSKDEFQILKEIFNLKSGKIEDDVETYTTMIQTANGQSKVVLTFNPKNTPSKRYIIEVVK